MGVGGRMVWDAAKMASWVELCLIGAWLIAGRGKNREKREEVRKAIEGSLCNLFGAKEWSKSKVTS